jgi:hypothetical protein
MRNIGGIKMRVKIWDRINNKELIYGNVKSIYNGSIIFILNFADDKKTKLEFNIKEYQIHFIYEER